MMPNDFRDDPYLAWLLKRERGPFFVPGVGTPIVEIRDDERDDPRERPLDRETDLSGTDIGP